MAQETLGASFSIDTTALKVGLAQANRLIRESESEFKAAAAGMEDWSKSQAGVEAKIKSLNSITAIQQKKVDALTSEYERLIADGLDPTSAQAIKLRTDINKEQAALESNKRELDKQTKALEEMSGETSENVTASQKLRNEIDKQEKSLADLSEEYANVVLEQGKNSGAAKELKTKINQLNDELKENKTKLSDASAALKDTEEKAKESGDGFTIAKGAIADFIGNGLTAIVGAAKNAISSLFNLAEETREFRQDMNTLTTAYSEAGFTAEEATDTWKNLYAIFGEDDRAVEAANNIARMAKNQKDLDEWTRITTGVWGTYQDALPVEALAESAGETAKVGKVTGNLADALNWSSEAATMFSKYMSEDVTNAEDAFNVALSECNTEAERQALITDTLTTLYGGAADKYNETAASVIEANKATADYTLTQAELGEKIEPITSKVRGGFAKILDKIVELVSDGSIDELGDKIDKAFSDFSENVLPKITDAIQWIIDNKEVIAGIAAVIGTVSVALGVLNTVLAIQSAIMAANPTTWIVMGIVAAVAALVAIIILCVKHWDKIKEAGKNAIDGIKNAWNSVATWFNEKIIQPVSNFFTGLWQGIKDKASEAWQGIKDVFSTVVQWLDEHIVQPIVNSTLFKIITELTAGVIETIKILWNIFVTWLNETIIIPVKTFFTDLWYGIKNKATEAWEAIKAVFGAVAEWFKAKVIQPVTNFFSNMWNSLKTKASEAWQGIKNVFSPVSEWFKNKFSDAWQKVKDVFSTGGKVFDGIKDGITSAFKTVVNAIIRGINKVIAVPFNAINNMLDKIRTVEIAGFSPFKNLISRFDVPSIPELEYGGMLRKGQKGFLEGKGDEVVIPLSRDKGAIKAIVDEMTAQGAGKEIVINQTNNYSQAHSRYEIYKSKQQTAAAVRLAMARG